MHPLSCVLILAAVLLERNVAITSDEDVHKQVDNCSKHQCMNVSLAELFQGTFEILESDLCEGACVILISSESDQPCECKLNGSALETRVGHLFIDFGQKILDFYNKTSSDVVPKSAEHFEATKIFGEINWFGWQSGRCTRSECWSAYWNLYNGNPPGQCTCVIGGDEEKELTFARYIFETGQMLLSFKP